MAMIKDRDMIRQIDKDISAVHVRVVKHRGISPVGREG